MKRILTLLLSLMMIFTLVPAAYAAGSTHETSNGAGAVISDGAALSVEPTVTTQPADANLAVGDTAKFTVVATGEGLTYRWQYKTPSGSWTNSGQTGYKTATLSVPVTAARNGYQYRCRVSNKAGEVFSDAATLTVKTAITAQPQSTKLRVGETATFTVAATGAGLTYRWQYRTSSTGAWATCGLTGSKTATLSVPVTAARNGYQYRCVINNANNSKAYSKATTLTVRTTIITQPRNTKLEAGNAAKFTVSATGAGLTYQWQYRTSSTGAWATCGLTGAKTATLSVPVTAARNGYQYRCVINNANNAKAYSNAATLTVRTTIYTQPQSVKQATGTTAKFTVVAYGAGLTYQWQYRTSSTGAWATCGLTGAKTATLSVPVTAARNGYQYRCVINNANNSKAYSNAATLTVDPYLAHGQCGDNLTWTLSYQGVLTISGTGAMWDESSRSRWYSVGDKITSVVISDGVTTIGNYAFFQVAVPKLTLGKDLKSIGDYAFRDTMDLETVTLPNGLKTIGKYAFFEAGGNEFGLKSITIPDSVTTIGEAAFGGCERLTSIRLPSGLKRIESRLLAGCEGLKSVTIPESVEYIGRSAFYGCSGITSLVIPKNVKEIWYYAMGNCYSLATVKFMGAAPETMYSNLFEYSSGQSLDHSVKVYYPSAYSSSWNRVPKESFGLPITWIAY